MSEQRRVTDAELADMIAWYGPPDSPDGKVLWRNPLRALRELQERRSADHAPPPVRDPNWCPICTPKGLGYCRCSVASNE
jgi:hypothetical protein